jgi:toxin YoeB
MRTPFQGIGKPEPLRGKLSGWRSRRIDYEHRLVYRPRRRTADCLLPPSLFMKNAEWASH